jgi:hypothetical protein
MVGKRSALDIHKDASTNDGNGDDKMKTIGVLSTATAFLLLGLGRHTHRRSRTNRLTSIAARGHSASCSRGAAAMPLPIHHSLRRPRSR